MYVEFFFVFYWICEFNEIKLIFEDYLKYM